MAERRRTSPVGRALLAVGAVSLAASVFLPWFSISGDSSEIPPSDYTGVTATDLLNRLAQGPWTWAAFGWLIVVVVIAFVSAGSGRTFANLGTSGILILVLYFILVAVSINLTNQAGTSGSASIELAYGFLVALTGSALIEVGTRIPKPKPKHEVPTASGPTQP